MRREGSALHGFGVVTLKEVADHFTSVLVVVLASWTWNPRADLAAELTVTSLAVTPSPATSKDSPGVASLICTPHSLWRS